MSWLATANSEACATADYGEITAANGGVASTCQGLDEVVTVYRDFVNVLSHPFKKRQVHFPNGTVEGINNTYDVLYNIYYYYHFYYYI